MGTVHCGDCTRDLPDSQHFTEVNPPGGYGRPQLLICDDCMGSDKWADWRSRKWVNWPNEPRQIGTGEI